MLGPNFNHYAGPRASNNMVQIKNHILFVLNSEWYCAIDFRCYKNFQKLHQFRCCFDSISVNPFLLFIFVLLFELERIERYFKFKVLPYTWLSIM